MTRNRDARITVVGVGGAGVNAISRLLDVGHDGARYVAIDTSEQTLARVPEPVRLPIAIGERGLGTGGDVRLGVAAAVACEGKIRAAVAGSDVVIVIAGMAGGTGGGAAPEVVRIARSAGASTIGFGVMPFGFEASRRRAAAEHAARRFQLVCDTYVPLENDRALAVTGTVVSLDVALRVADDGLRQAVQGLAEMLNRPGWIHVDLATVRDVLSDGGRGCVVMGIGRGAGAAAKAIDAALASPLLARSSWRQARAALVQVSGGPDLTVDDVAAVAGTLQNHLAPDCELVVGAGPDPALLHSVQVTVLVAQMSETPVREPIPLALAQARRTEMAYRVAVPDLERQVV